MSLFRAVYVPFLAAVSVTLAIAIGFTAYSCGFEAILSLGTRGTCSLADSPAEAFSLYTVIGAMAGMTLLAAWTAVRLFAGGGKE